MASDLKIGATAVSVIVTLGFFGALFMFMLRPPAIANSPEAWSVLNILIGVLGAKFGDVVAFNIGSTSTSKTKDETIKALAQK